MIYFFFYFYFKDLFGVVPVKKQQEKTLEEKAKQSESLKKASSLLFSSDEEVLRSKVWLKGVTGLYAGQSIKPLRQEPQSNSSVSTCHGCPNPVTCLQLRKLSDSWPRLAQDLGNKSHVEEKSVFSKSFIERSIGNGGCCQQI